MEWIFQSLLPYMNGIVTILKFVFNRSGKEYGIGACRKAWLAYQVLSNNRKIKSLTTSSHQLQIINDILRVPKDLEGVVVECGCFNGASSTNLSLACAMTGRRLLICDSFEGLPEPEEGEKLALYSKQTDPSFYRWEKGDFKSDNQLEGVKNNIQTYGDISVCEFIKGYFNETLKNLPADQIVVIFEDADLPSSVRDCLLYLYPRMQNGCKFWCHEPWSIDVVGLFYDQAWWKENLNTTPPGFWGSGSGVVSGITYTGIGYSQKVDKDEVYQTAEQRMHQGAVAFGTKP